MNKYTDEALQEVIAVNDTMTPGPMNCARHLLRLDTPERRLRAQQEGNTLTNLMGGRPSDRVYEAVTALLQNIANGTEDEELYGERIARQEREREQAFREARRG
jgi:hypothetical protein